MSQFLNLVAVIPGIGAIKYGDEAGTVVKGIGKNIGDVAEEVKNGRVSIDDLKANPSVFSGKSVDEIAQALTDAVYDDFEEVWESDKGVFIEMDAETNKARWISVYIPELDLENFEDCQW